MSSADLNMKEVFSGVAGSHMVLDLTIQRDCFDFASSISSALEQADLEIQALDENIASIKGLKPECDKLERVQEPCVVSLIFF